MELSRFDQEEWAAVRVRLKDREGGFDEASFVGWLTSEGTEEKIVTRLGPDWRLGDALTMATGGPKVVRRAGRKKLKAALEGKGDVGAVEAAPGAEIGELRERIENLESKVEARVAEYEAGFENVAPNDRASLYDLAYAEIALGELNKLRVFELAKEFPNAEVLKRQTEGINILSAQTRALQKMLDIDRVARSKKTEDESDLDKVMGVIEDAGKWVEEEAIELRHNNVLLGWLVSDFPEFEHVVRVKLPEGWVEVRYSPDQKALRAVEPDWIEDEESKYRVQAIAGMEDE